MVAESRTRAGKAPIPVPNHMFIFGLGFTGLRLAIELGRLGWIVSGTVQSEEKKKEIEKEHPFIKVIVVDDHLDNNSLDSCLEGITHILATAPVNKRSGEDPILETFGDAITTRSINGQIFWAGYLSTTSVYGDHKGAWVTETTKANPTLKRGRLRKHAEESWLATGAPVHIFRLPGIYGPFRGTVNRARKGAAKMVYKEGQVFSRIHVDDIVGVLIASIRLPNPGRVYNVVDDTPEANWIVTEHAYNLLKRKAPEKMQWEVAKKGMSPMSLSFYSESKRVSNKRIKDELGYTLLYPSYKEGFPAQIQEEECKMKNLHEKKIKKGGLQWSLGHLVFHRFSFGLIPRHVFAFISVGVNALRGLYRSVMSFAKEQLPSPKTRDVLCLLVDNGSLRPEPTLQFRKYAKMLEEASSDFPFSLTVKAVSARHSHKIPVEQLDGISAETLAEIQSNKEGFSSDQVLCVPMFLSNSRTVTSFIPGALTTISNQSKKRFSFRVSDPLVKPTKILQDLQEPCSIESILCNMIRRVRENIPEKEECAVVLVDHGSPSRDVNAVRRGLAGSLRIMLGDEVSKVVDCSMERREGEYYDFNDPLLENVFDLGGMGVGSVILAYAFLAPGRHAGKDGDIEEILNDVKARHPELKIYQTGLIADDENRKELQNLLSSRLRSIL
mmetsp:Transcript_6493/g.7425  ORF Transcript_6493/g.7425 Transcript_6493/m.7425 type:complete len:668 (+) Transcript_6493:89-2092(+)